MKYKILISTIGAILAAAIMLGLWPIPREREAELTFPAWQMTADGSQAEECTMKLYAVTWDYLLKKDGYKSISITVGGQELRAERDSDSVLAPVTADDIAYEYLTFMCTVSSDLCPVEVFLDKEQRWCAVEINLPRGEPLVYIGVANADMDVKAVYQYLYP